MATIMNIEGTAADAVVEVRQIHFDASGVGLGIVGKDHLEDGAFVLAPEFESNLAARYVLADGVVVDGYEGKTDDEVIAVLAQAEAERAAALVEVKTSLPKIITKLAFMDLFTETELEAIYEGAKQSAALEVYLDKLKVADHVDLHDPRTVAGLNRLKDAGILSADRVAAISTNRVPS